MAHLRDQLREQLKRVRDHLDRALVRGNQLRASHPREVKAAIRVTAAVAILCVVAAGWFLLSLTRSLPDQAALTAMGEMDQATAVYDASDPWRSRSSKSSASTCRSTAMAPAPRQGARRDRGSPLLRSSRLRSRPHRVGGA